MTKKQIRMAQDLLDLLSSESLRDWTHALSAANPDINAYDILILKKRLRAAISKYQATKSGKTTSGTRRSSRGNLLSDFDKQDAVGEFAAGQRGPLKEEFSRWLKIISLARDKTLEEPPAPVVKRKRTKVIPKQ